MTWAQDLAAATTDDLLSPQFVEASEMGEALGTAEKSGLLPVLVPPPGPGQRGRLALVVEMAVEEALSQRAGAPPGVGASSDLDASLSDQIYRARLVGCSGLALGFPSLEGIANLAGTLDAEDSAVLRWWIATATERPIRLYLARRDRFLGVYGPPTLLHSLVQQATKTSTVSAEGGEELAPVAAPEVAASVATMELSSPPPEVEEPTAATPPQSAPIQGDVLERHQPAEEENAGQANANALTNEGSQAATDRAVDSVARIAVAKPVVPDSPVAAVGTPEESVPEPAGPAGESAPGNSCPVHSTGTATTTTPDEREPRGTQPYAAPPPNELEPLTRPLATPPAPKPSLLLHQPLELDPESFTDSEPGPEPPSAEPAQREVKPLHANAAEQWRSWVMELDAARGPKPLGVVERMFVTAYAPLLDAYTLGIADAQAREVLDTWGGSFEKSYTDAFDALRLRGKRPTMVLDVPDIAHRLARLHGARSVQLLLVDGLRYDVGQRMHEYLGPQLERRAALTERLLLWSALPTTTSTQLDLIGRGPEGLREAKHSADAHQPVAHGRSAALPRRIKAGRREVMKLDLVEARTTEGGDLGPVALDELARQVAESVAAHFGRLRERTLAMVFGDHGFRVDDGEGPAHQGGARPEEVLVPAYAWLLGQVH